uniref:PAT complex subunit CCDC47 n=1 Tax=Plectus sambesii TaxID=2011161 RepID=A0A914V8L4_9BILA
MEKKNADKLGLPASFTIFSEISEATTSMIDPRVTQVINKYEECIDYIHFSDQYSGLKPQEGETQTRLPESANVLVFGFNIPGKMGASERHIEQIKPLLSMVFYCLDKVRRYRLSREGKAKADKNRQSAQEAFLKTTHLQRQEAAQARREEKTRERKQRLMEEEDPDRQRRLE